MTLKVLVELDERSDFFGHLDFSTPGHSHVEDHLRYLTLGKQDRLRFGFFDVELLERTGALSNLLRFDDVRDLVEQGRD